MESAVEGRDSGLYKNHSLLTIISANMGLLAYAASTSFIDGWNYFFLQNFTLVGTGFLLVIQIVYLVWDAFNDPIFGFISDRQFKFSKKMGRRFPWILIFMAPFAFSMWFIFAIPDGLSRGAAITWATVALLMYETFYTIIQTSSGALYPDKFRTERDRKRLTVVNQVMWFLGLMSGILLPGLFIGETATRETLSSAALWLAIISLAGMLLMLPGVRETKEMIARNERTQTEKQTIGKFFKTFGRLLKNKNFLGYFFVTLGMAILQALIITSVPYIVLYIVQAPESFLFTYSIYIQISYAVAAVLFVPLWILLQRKYSYQKLYKVAFLVIPVGLIPFIFVSNIWIFVGGAFFIGIGIGGLSVLGARMFWDVIDESCAECGERQEGAYSSIFTFLQRIGPIIGTGFFALIQILTGFIPGQEDITGSVTYVPVGAQPASAFLGIRLIISVIPIAVALLGFLIFQLLYKLNPDKVNQNVMKLKELGI